MLKEGRAALARGEWKEARARFERAVGLTKDSPEGWENLGMAAWWLEDYPAAIEARERAYRLYRQREDGRGSARMAFYLALDFADYKGDAVVAQGWVARGRRLLEGLPPSPELAMMLLLEGHQLLMSDNDTLLARKRAAEAIEIARAVGPPDAEVLGLAMEGLARVSEGDVAGGMRLLDEATVAALSGELTDLNIVGTACCYLIHACERVRDLERAAQWCERVQEFCRRWNFTAMFTVCRTQYASVLMLQGEWAKAEAELDAATDELRATRPAAISSGIIRLAELRRRQGRLDEAADLFDHVPHHRLSLIGRGEIALQRGRLDEARQCAAQYLRRFPKQTRSERIAGLDLSVRVEATAGRPEVAVGALQELCEAVEELGTDPLRATAIAAEGIVARAAGDPERARVCLEDAADLFERSGIPYEGAAARLELATLLAAQGHPDESRRHAERSRATFARLGAAGQEGKALALLAPTLEPSSGPDGAPPPRRAAKGLLTSREIEVLRLVARGLSDKQIAERLYLSQHTVHRHVSNVLTKLDVSSRAAAVARASGANIL
jgi:ATP/maltotriose-dependent transcriptional regulator MalT